jgi:TPR repeat protein
MAQWYLGELYRDGLGGDRDDGKAREWFQLAADQGNELAQKEIDRLNKEKESKGFFSRFF